MRAHAHVRTQATGVEAGTMPDVCAVLREGAANPVHYLA